MSVMSLKFIKEDQLFLAEGNGAATVCSWKSELSCWGVELCLLGRTNTPARKKYYKFLILSELT